MKKYIATQAQLVARNSNLKDYKNLIESIMDDIMYLVQEASRRGEYKTAFETDNFLDESGYVQENLIFTVQSLLKEMGYNVSYEKDDGDGCTTFFISWV